MHSPETAPIFSQRRSKFITANVIVPRVKSPHELRIGFEKIGCPDCYADCWVSSQQLKAIEKGGTMICRECVRV